MSEARFERLFREHYAICYRRAYALLNDSEEARDVASGVFTDILARHIHLGEPPTGLLLTMVRNRAVDLLRRRRVDDEARQHFLREEQATVAPEEASDDRLKAIMHFVQTELTPQTQRVLSLCYDEKHSYREAALALGISTQAVNKHISQALRKLRERFNPEYQSPKKQKNDEEE